MAACPRQPARRSCGSDPLLRELRGVCPLTPPRSSAELSDLQRPRWPLPVLSDASDSSAPAAAADAAALRRGALVSGPVSISRSYPAVPRGDGRQRLGCGESGCAGSRVAQRSGSA